MLRTTLLQPALALTLILVSITLYAGEPVTVEDAWIREAPPGAKALAGYLTAVNASAQERRLVAAESPAFDRIELHRSVFEGGVARMLAQDSMPIPAGGRLVLKPGDYHLMMIKPKDPLHQGDEVEVTLILDNQTKLRITMPVKKAQAEGHDHMHGHDHEHHQH